jgi:hypothetical protein
VLVNARREARCIALLWLAATTYCCTYCYFFGYRTATHPLGVADIQPIFGIPSWVVWGIFAPWIVCALFTFWFAGRYMADDDLGQDHSRELEADIRQGGLNE